MGIYWTAAFVVPALLAFLSTPLVIRLAHRIGAIDQPDERKAHVTPMPRLGGAAVFGSFALSLFFLHQFLPEALLPEWAAGTQGILLTICVSCVFGIGILDDLYTLKPAHKLFFQFLMSTILYYAGFRIDAVTALFGEGSVHLGAFNYLLTVTWMIGVTNAINLIDGLDGLASGVSAIAALTIVAISVLKGDSGTALMALVLAGSIVGFLRYNFNPAKVFLGDSGSMFIGLTLAIISTQSSTKSSTAFSLLVPVMALGLPIMDTLLSMARRLVEPLLGAHPVAEHGYRRFTSMFHPDRRHIHHRLMALGLTHRTAVLVLYVVSCALGLGALLITVVNNTGASLVLFVVGIASVLGIRMLQYREMALFRNGVLLPLFDLRLLNHHLFQAFLDGVFMVFAYAGAHFFTHWSLGDSEILEPFALPLGVACVTQLTVFYVTGCYRGTIRQFDMVDALKVTRATAVAVVLSGVLFSLIPGSAFQPDGMILVLDFYFLLTFTLGSRFAFRVLKFLSEVHAATGRRVIIYGADDWGTFLLQRILDNHIPDLQPVGFLDDRPRNQGKQVLGFPVLGDYTALERLTPLFDLDEIVVAVPDISSEVLLHLQERAAALGLRLRAFSAQLVEVEAHQPVHPDLQSHKQRKTSGGIPMTQKTNLLS